MPNFTVAVIPMLEDNFCYYVHPDGSPQTGFFVDTAVKSDLANFVTEYGLQKVTHIFTTHHHYDHAGGNNQIKNVFNDCIILGGEADNVEGCTHFVKDGDRIDLFDAQLKIACIHTPCHTRGSTCYYVESNEC